MLLLPSSVLFIIKLKSYSQWKNDGIPYVVTIIHTFAQISQLSEKWKRLAPRAAEWLSAKNLIPNSSNTIINIY